MRPMTDIGTQIREAREDLGWTQKELGRRAGVDPRTVRRIESGESRYPAKAGLLQQALRIGPYAPPATAGVLLRDATFAELMHALATRHGAELLTAGVISKITTMDEVPPEVVADYLRERDDMAIGS
jgi:transcriptional regulator with XRE-family HTH domain